MSFSVGLVGLPNAGKTTLFNALGSASAPVAGYPFTTIEPNVAIVPVPDPRLDALAESLKPERVVPASIEMVDIAGLIRGSHRGEGLGNQFLSHIRTVDAIAQVVRCFADPEVTHLEGTVDAQRDAATVSLELALADLALAERRQEAATRAAKSGERRAQAMLELLQRLVAHLDAGRPVRHFEVGPDDQALLAELDLLTLKPVLLVANVDETHLAEPQTDPCVRSLASVAEAERAEWVAVAAQMEASLAEWPADEAAAYREAVGVRDSGLLAFVQASYRLLRLVTFFTATGGQELRAWAVPDGTTAPAAAGKVHSDMERGFIRAEVVSTDELLRVGSMAAARDGGLLRVEGRNYVVRDGDLVQFRFHV